MFDSFMDTKEVRIITTVGCFLSDVTLFSWIYWQATQYHQFNQLIESSLNSPSFELQLYKVLLQSLTFFLLLFVSAQFVVYVLSWKKMRAALLYLKLYSVLGFAISLLVTLTSSPYALCPALFYLAGYYYFAKTFKATGVQMQNPPL